MRGPLMPLLLRLFALVAGICLVAVVFRIVGQALGILPPALQSVFGAGFAGLYATVAPALPTVAGLGIVIAIVWLVLAGRR